MHKSQSLFYLTTALHVSGVTITHLQHKTTVTTASGNTNNQDNVIFVFALQNGSSNQNFL